MTGGEAATCRGAGLWLCRLVSRERAVTSGGVKPGALVLFECGFKSLNMSVRGMEI